MISSRMKSLLVDVGDFGGVKMKKFWIVYGQKNEGMFLRYDTYQQAEDQAKRQSALPPYNDYIILEAVAQTKQPIPAIDIEKLQ